MDPFAYDQSKPLDVQTVALGRRGPVDLEGLTYRGTSGQRVSALFARPRQAVGCLMYQGFLGSTKEEAAPIWTGAAKLNLATFTIDVPGLMDAPAIEAVLNNADSVRRVLTDTVIDLRRALDYLETRPECRHNVGFLGSSLGAILGALLTGDDARVRTAVLTSIGGTWRGALARGDGLVLPGIAARAAQFDAAVKTLQPLDAARWVARIAPRPVMLVNGLEDPLTPVRLALVLDAAARQPKVVLHYKGGHNPFAGAQGRQVARQVAAFFTRTLGARAS